MKTLFKKLIASKRLTLFLSFFRSSELGLSSIAVAYYLLVSIFPLLLIVGNALPYFKINTNQLVHFVEANLPGTLADSIVTLIKSVLSQPNTSLLTISIVAGLWVFSQALSALQQAFNKAYNVELQRDFILSRVFSLIVGLLILISLYFSIAIAAFGPSLIEQIQKRLHLNEIFYQLLHNLTLPAVILFALAALALLYSFLPNARLKKIRYILPGTIFSAVTIFFSTSIIGWLVSLSLRKLQDFKVIGSLFVFVLMLWFIFLARVLIFGAVLNATYQKYKEGTIQTRRGEVIEFIKNIGKTDD